MKNFALYSILGLLTLPAFAVQNTNFSELKTESMHASATLNFDPSCSFSARETSQGLDLQMQDSEHSLRFIVREQDQVLLTMKSGTDGSYVRQYQIGGVGMLTIHNEDDAHYSIELANSEKTIRCAVEF